MHRLCLQGLHTWTYSKGAIRNCVRCRTQEVRTNDGWELPQDRTIQTIPSATKRLHETLRPMAVKSQPDLQENAEDGDGAGIH
jgi:hypothetical protein